MVISRTNGGKSKMSDFMPYEHPSEPQEGDISDVFNLLASTANKG